MSDERLMAILRAKRAEREGTKTADTQAGLWDRRTPQAGHDLATAGADAAAARAERLSSGYKALARKVALELFADGGTVTSEDIRARCPVPEGADPRALGHVLRALSLEGLIEKVDVVTSTRPEHHAGLVTVWKAKA